MRFSFPAFCCCAVLSLNACMEHPNYMARGYASYDQEYKSAPGPAVNDIGYEYSYQNNKAVLKDIRYVAHDLVEKLDKKLAPGVDEIYLKIQSESAFYNSFDHAIRGELTKRGYLLANTPVNMLTLDFVVVDDLPECTGVEQGEGVYRKMFLALAINVTEGMPQDMVGDYYEVPTYDFEDGDTAGINLSLCPEEEQVIDVTQAMKEYKEQYQEEAQIQGEIYPEEMQQKEDEKIDISDIIPDLLGTEQTNAPEDNPEYKSYGFRP